MKKPSKEQILYAQLAIAEGIINYIHDNLEDSIFEGKNIDTVLSAIMEDIFFLQYAMNLAFETQEPRSVCY